LFGYLEGDLTATSSATIFFAMALLHFVVGALIFSRIVVALPLGLLVAITGLVIAALQPQFVLVFTNCVILALLIFARSNVATGRRAV
jgi:hypothetical protein